MNSPSTSISTDDLTSKQAKLDSERTKFERERLEFEQKKLQRLTIAVSIVAVLVSVLQVGVAYLQSRLSAAQTVETFIPHLQKQETRDAALLTMSAFLEQDLVTKLAEKLRATAVLETLQARGSDQDKTQASDALAAIDARRKTLVSQIFDDDKARRIQATTELVRQWGSDPKLVPAVLEFAAPRSKNLSGTINALVVLREASPEALRSSSTELNQYLESVKGNGEQTNALVAGVINRLSPAR